MTTFKQPEWLYDAIFYQIFPDRFANGDPSNDPEAVLPWGSEPDREHFMGGDLQGIIQNMDYLQSLGINALYLNPIFKAGTNHRYDTFDYYEIDPALGTKAVFKQLVEKAHRMGIRIVLDGVFNHCGLEFGPFLDLIKNGNKSAYKDWFMVESFPVNSNPLTYQTCGGAEYLPKLNTANLEVQEYFLKVAEYWIREFGIDGWRLDVPWKADFEFWKRFRSRVKEVRQDAYIVGEIWRDTLTWLDGSTCDGTMNYPLREYLLDYCIYDHMDAEDFSYFLSRWIDVLGENRSSQLNLVGSHDTPRMLELAGGDISKVTMAIGLQFILPGVPMIYYGDEVGIRGVNDPDCRRCMKWDSDEWNMDIFQYYQKMILIRKDNSWLSTAQVRIEKVFNGLLVMWLENGNNRILVVANSKGISHNQSIALEGVKSNKIMELITGTHYNIDENLFLEKISERSIMLFMV